MYRQVLLFLLTPWSLVLWVAFKLLGLLRLSPDHPLPLHGPSGAILLTTADWERHMALRYPFRWRLTRLFDYPRRRRLRKIKVKPHKDMILDWPFRALASWVEKNHGKVWAVVPNGADPLYDGYHDAMAEVRSLYVWWVKRKARIAMLDNEDLSMREYQISAMREEDQLMLARLVNVRMYLD